MNLAVPATSDSVMMRLLRAALCAALLVRAGTALGREIDVPLRFDHEFIRQIVLAQVYTSAGGKAFLWDDGTGCGYLTLREPAVNSTGNRLRIVTRGEARVGTPIGDQCFAAIQWDGFIEILEEPKLSDDQHELRFRVVESNLYNTEWKKGSVTGKIWGLVKQYVQPNFEAVRVDLHAPLQDLRDLLPLIVARGDAERIAQILESVHLAAATPTDTGVTASLAFTVNPTTPAAGPTPEPTLTSEELQRWEASWQRWDAFLTFVITQLGTEASTKELRLTLSDVLIDARFDILEALAPSAPGAPDPTRTLFLQTWERLVPAVRQAATGLPSAAALRYVSFVAAGDALAALDQAGPDIGLDISADGLRRLARIVAPLSTQDPLLYSMAVDPQLRQVVGLGAPLPPPDLSDAPTDESWWQRGWLLRPAIAVEEKPAAKTLERWVADSTVLDAYLQAIREVLDDVSEKTLAGSDIEPRYHAVYHYLVLAAAWQESCWRQFVRSGGAVTYLKSPVGSTGMMQVNEHVWRGMYDLRGLRWDIRYNGRAGSEILMHYLHDYAIAKKEDAQPGGIDNLARATYAVYNGGPGHLTRYRKANTKKTLKRIDELFAEKYHAVTSGKASDVSRCIVGG
jgi:soluble lytic murein transglycosylase-like protein